MPLPLNSSPGDTTKINYLDLYLISPYAANLAEQAFNYCGVTSEDEKRELLRFVTQFCPTLAESPEIIFLIPQICSVKKLGEADQTLAAKAKIIKTSIDDYEKNVDKITGKLEDIANQQFCIDQNAQRPINELNNITKAIQSAIDDIPTAATDKISQKLSEIIAAATTTRRDSATITEKLKWLTYGLIAGLIIGFISGFLLPKTTYETNPNSTRTNHLQERQEFSISLSRRR